MANDSSDNYGLGWGNNPGGSTSAKAAKDKRTKEQKRMDEERAREIAQKAQLDQALQKGMTQGRVLAADRLGASSQAAARTEVTSPEQAQIIKLQQAALNENPDLADVIARRRSGLEDSPEVADIIARRKAGLEGLNAQENAALRAKMKDENRRTTMTGLRSLRGMQAAAGVRGGAAGAQLAGALSEGAKRASDNERELLIKNIEMRRQALNDFEGSVNTRDANRGQRLGDFEKSILTKSESERAARNDLESTIARRDEAARTHLMDKLAVELGMGQSELGTVANLQAATMERLAQGGGTVICTIMWKHGLLDNYHYAHDAVYGQWRVDPTTHKGYYVWAQHVAKILDRSPTLRRLVFPLVRAWTGHVTFIMGGALEDSTVGRLINKVFAPICNLIGRVIK